VLFSIERAGTENNRKKVRKEEKKVRVREQRAEEK
jgi:hypothetical protein